MYAPVAIRAAHLYFAVTELVQVNQMYQYSLKWFLNVNDHITNGEDTEESLKNILEFDGNNA